ncbi:SIS domain-containing protein [Pseudohongiella spirulinae]|uniref:RpiR family transcriptional regulator n=1 Tax=Pseudohongiella spirulinae TaxID=1249552 RepID=A0A0S2KH68_9GAMM|nr:SIS domain-containing protein [Pseudohongiella spirulinae]ALO47665.1 RpiR family transcriptional regulator [Pseudohongiella spirulinae]
MEAQNLISKIKDRRESLRKSERKVADFVIDNAAAVLSMRIMDVAAQAQVSEPTVVRFCRALDFDGFQSFKLQLAQHLGASSSYSQFSVDDTDTVADVSHKVFDSTIGSLITVRDELDPQALELAIAAINQANRVEFYGFGASGSVASDAQHKFFRLQLSSAAYTDPHIQHMSAISLSPKDVVVAISQSGRTKALIQSVELALDAGATVVGLAPQDTPLSRLSSIPIYVNMEEDLQIFTPVSSRIAHLLVIDVLAMGVARLRKDQLKDYLKRINRSLRTLRTQKPGQTGE